MPWLAYCQPMPSTPFGDARLTNAVIVSAKSCKLWAAYSYNNSAATVYLQIFQTKTNPPNGSIPKLSYPVPAASFISYDFSAYGLDMDACTICVSTNALVLGEVTNSASINGAFKNN